MAQKTGRPSKKPSQSGTMTPIKEAVMVFLSNANKNGTWVTGSSSSIDGTMKIRFESSTQKAFTNPQRQAITIFISRLQDTYSLTPNSKHKHVLQKAMMSFFFHVH